MAFPDLTSKRQTLSIFDLMVLVAIAALPLAGSRSSQTLYTFSFSLPLFLVGGVLWWLPRLGSRSRLGPLVLPVFVAVAVLYLLFAFVAFVWSPDLTILIISTQLLALIYVSFRI